MPVAQTITILERGVRWVDPEAARPYPDWKDVGPTLQLERVRWRYSSPRRGVITETRPLMRRIDVRNALNEFEKLADGDPESFRAFMQRFGPLPLCARHAAPLDGHLWTDPDTGPPPVDENDPIALANYRPPAITEARPLCTAFALQHPLTTYRGLAQEVRAARACARALHEYQHRRESRRWADLVAWRELEPQLAILNVTWPPRTIGPGRPGKPTHPVRRAVAAVVNTWLMGTGATPRMEWPDAGVPHLTFDFLNNNEALITNRALWSAIAEQLVAAVAARGDSARYVSLCLACGVELVPHQGRGRPAQYCPTHKAMRSTLNKRRQRRTGAAAKTKR